MGIDGKPHPSAGGWFSKPSGSANWSKALGGGGGAKKGDSCAVTLLGLLSAPWLLDLLLAGSRTVA